MLVYADAGSWRRARVRPPNAYFKGGTSTDRVRLEETDRTRQFYMPTMRRTMPAKMGMEHTSNRQQKGVAVVGISWMESQRRNLLFNTPAARAGWHFTVVDQW